MDSLTVEQARQIDRFASEQLGISGLVLMENAGRGATDLLCALNVTSPIVVCCGKGNNAGDGYVIARHLLARNYKVRILNWEPPERIVGDARTNYDILSAMDAEMIERAATEGSNASQILANAAWIVDAILGTGASGPPRPPIDQAIEAINAARGQTFAVDIPSGLDCNTGLVAGTAVRANHTCTFLAPKQGLLREQGKAHTGQLHVVDLGISSKMRKQALEQSGDNPPSSTL